MALKILATADIHFERLDKDKLNKYTKYFTDSIMRFKPDMFIIAGDTADSRNLKAESEEYHDLNMFLSNISNKCYEEGVEFIILEGTPSHDGKVVRNIIDISELKITYYESLTRVHRNGISMLFMPEMYVPSYEIFEEKITEVIGIDNKVDICIFHAMFDFPIPALKQIDSQFNQSRTVVINNKTFTNKFINIASFGGHVHKSISEDKTYYLGRFVNEKHQMKDSDLFGLKFITVDNGNFSISNIQNPYMNEYDFLTININKHTSVDGILDYISSSNITDPDKTIFQVNVDNDSDSRFIFGIWKRIYKPKHLKRKIVNPRLNGVEPEAVSKVSSTKLDASDIDSMISEMYEEITNNKLEEEIISKIKGE